MIVIENCIIAPLTGEEQRRVLAAQQEALLEIADWARQQEAWARAEAGRVRERWNGLYP